MITAPQQPMTPDSDFYVQQSGAMTIAHGLSDSLTRTMLVRAYERQAVGSASGLAYRDTPGAGLANARWVFQQWALRMRSWLDEVCAIPPLPADDAQPGGPSSRVIGPSPLFVFGNKNLGERLL